MCYKNDTQTCIEGKLYPTNCGDSCSSSDVMGDCLAPITSNSDTVQRATWDVMVKDTLPPVISVVIVFHVRRKLE